MSSQTPRGASPAIAAGLEIASWFVMIVAGARR
jgi:hypothetical protein